MLVMPKYPPEYRSGIGEEGAEELKKFVEAGGTLMCFDSACELVDFFRFNVFFAEQLYNDQPISTTGRWNRMEYRGLEGFVFAVTPFNFSSIAGNLPTAPARGRVAVV